MQAVNNSIKARYAEESTANCSLSCGNNLDYLELKPGERVLDLGCGTGHETIAAAKLVGDRGEAVGLDLTPEMLTVARQNASARGLSNVFFVSGSIEDLPFSNNIFDVIISNCVINHAADKEQVYREILRVLKSGGRFVVSDAVSKKDLPEHIKNDPRQWAACFGGASTEENYLQCIREAGFADINILSRREYQKNGFDFVSLTIQAIKP